MMKKYYFLLDIYFSNTNEKEDNKLKTPEVING